VEGLNIWVLTLHEPPRNLPGGFMKNKSNLGRSDSLPARLIAFGRLYLMLYSCLLEPLSAFGLASLATVMLSKV